MERKKFINSAQTEYIEMKTEKSHKFEELLKYTFPNKILIIVFGKII